ncbi:MAG: DUF3987 domain-containing protein, partial [Planctomycetes bacterium]|nr:DUF3987 domain-containing protein [Planctomycetota bacterium]
MRALAENASQMEFLPFPLDALPRRFRGFVDAASLSLGCDPVFFIPALLAAAGAAIGNTHRVQLKPGWEEPSVVWAFVVAASGSLKTPAFSAALEPILSEQKTAFLEYQEAMERHEDELERWKAESKRRRGSDDESHHEPKPEPPACRRLYCADITIEALVDRLQGQPRGLLVYRDEASGWISSFDRYAKAQGGEVAQWLEMHRAGQVIVDRKSTEKKVIFVPNAAISITGGIQPGILRDCLSGALFQNGLAARMLMAM